MQRFQHLLLEEAKLYAIACIWRSMIENDKILAPYPFFLAFQVPP
ncbi:hypothetical protein [Trichocoleus sp. FACHB-6]|nr:hypothetical protein [Trichocoleus sp. FACHB-6]